MVFGLAGCLALVALVRCQPASAPAAPSPEIELDWSITPNPPAAGPVRLSLTLTDVAKRQPVQGAAVRLEGNMSHPGMQPVFGEAREVAPGTYEASLDLTMGGDWFFLVEARLSGGGTLRRQVDLPGVRSR
jgi:hypothetical protein